MKEYLCKYYDSCVLRHPVRNLSIEFVKCSLKSKVNSCNILQSSPRKPFTNLVTFVSVAFLKIIIYDDSSLFSHLNKGFPGGLVRFRDVSWISGLGRIPWSRKRQPLPVILPGKSHGQWLLMGYSPWDCAGLD